MLRIPQARGHVLLQLADLHTQGADMGGPLAAVQAAREALGLGRLESFPVQHCAHAFGCMLESAAGWKLALSGDTRPCPAVAEAARDATILIHEVCASLALHRCPR